MFKMLICACLWEWVHVDNKGPEIEPREGKQIAEGWVTGYMWYEGKRGNAGYGRVFVVMWGEGGREKKKRNG